jgi:hypothetical protein
MDSISYPTTLQQHAWKENTLSSNPDLLLAFKPTKQFENKTQVAPLQFLHRTLPKSKSSVTTITMNWGFMGYDTFETAAKILHRLVSFIEILGQIATSINEIYKLCNDWSPKMQRRRRRRRRRRRSTTKD